MSRTRAISQLTRLIAVITVLRQFCQVQGQCVPLLMRMEGKVVLITGGNSGIGKETALDIAQRGAKVYIACRNPAKCETAKEEIVNSTQNQNVFGLALDLASFASIRNFSSNFHQLETRLDVLINNAGTVASKKTLTKDGFEMDFGVNHLGHFLLTNLLLDLVKAAAPSRIVVVSSEAHFMADLRRDDLNYDNRTYSWTRAYASSKLANLLFSNELSRRLATFGVTVNSLHPGVVNTKVAASFSWFINFLLTPVRNYVLKTPKQGAQTSIYLAVDPQLATVTGRYFIDCKEAYTTRMAQDAEFADWLWNKSVELTALNVQQDYSEENSNLVVEIF